MSADAITQAQQVLGEGEGCLLEVLPAAVAAILRDRLWAQVKNKQGQHFNSFREFCEYKLWWGLECPYERLVDYCKSHDEARRLLADDLEPVAAHGGKREQGDNVTLHTDSERGNATTYTIRRLKRDNPELAERVISGELSANAAALLAGFRRPSLQIPADDAQRAAEAIRRRLGNDFALALGTAISDEDGKRNRAQIPMAASDVGTQLVHLWSLASAHVREQFAEYIEAPQRLEEAIKHFSQGNDYVGLILFDAWQRKRHLLGQSIGADEYRALLDTAIEEENIGLAIACKDALEAQP